MRESHPTLDRDVAPDAVLWRYMDFPKFLSMLSNGALWFSRADLLGDPLEGSFTQARELERQDRLENPPEGRTREELEDVFRSADLASWLVALWQTTMPSRLTPCRYS